MDEVANGLLARIAVAKGELSRSEQRVADFVLAHAARVVSLSIGALAETVGVSEPTVARFCKSMGFSGLKELKIQLTRSLAGGIPYVHQDVAPGDDPKEIAEKVLNRTIATLVGVRDRLDPVYLGRAASLVASASRVEFYGQGNSGIVAADAEHKFFRLGLTTASHSDPHVHAMSAALVSGGTVVVAISASGRTLDILRSVQIARESGARTIAITSGGSPLARACDVVLATDVFEDSDIYAPMVSRLAHLAIIDALAVAVAVARGPALIDHLRRAKATVREKRPKSAH